MRAIKMTSKKSGTCKNCRGSIRPGQSILWARGSGAVHVDCKNAGYVSSQCSACNGAGVRWDNSPCVICGGSGKAVDIHHEDRGPDIDTLYEDDCARRCGL